jgi:acetyl esterase/lipase
MKGDKLIKIARFIGLIVAMPFVVIAQEEGVVKTDSVKYKPVVYPSTFTAQLNEVYTTVDGWDGRMDLYYQPAATKPTPIVINIHGGGWKNGVKETQGGFTPFFKEGISVANVEYRMTPQAKAPAAVQDLRCALIYIMKNAAKFNIDVNRIVVMGGSAGGHLALMTGLLGNNHQFDGNCPGVDKIQVAAIIDKYGITDVWNWAYGNHGPGVRKSSSAKDWLGDKKTDSLFARTVSPVSYLNKNNPPILIIHGNADSSVPYRQSVELHQKLNELGVQNEFITVEGGGHGKFTKEKNAELALQIIEFIKKTKAFTK